MTIRVGDFQFCIFIADANVDANSDDDGDGTKKIFKLDQFPIPERHCDLVPPLADVLHHEAVQLPQPGGDLAPRSGLMRALAPDRGGYGRVLLRARQLEPQPTVLLTQPLHLLFGRYILIINHLEIHLQILYNVNSNRKFRAEFM